MQGSQQGIFKGILELHKRGEVPQQGPGAARR